MATLELSVLTEKLEHEEIRQIHQGLDEVGAPDLDEPELAETVVLTGRLDEDMFADFLDQLEANDVAADVYLPVEFDDVYETKSGTRVGSVHALLAGLESLREDLDIDPGEDEFDDEEDFDEEEEDEVMARFDDDNVDATVLKDEQMRAIWKSYFGACNAALKDNLAIFVTV